MTIAVGDDRSITAMRVISRRLGRICGGSTGTNIWAAAILASEMAHQGQQGSIVSILCDGGERYRETYFSDDWVRERGWNLAPLEAKLDHFFRTGIMTD